MLPKLSVVLGGARSGKSSVAERLVGLSGLPRVYIATAQAFDDEMRARIAAHREDRGASWRTVEAPDDPGAVLVQASGDEVILLDCATLWLSNRVLAEADIASETDALITALATCPAPVVVVSNEVGLSIVPENALARRFRDEQGRLNQRLAAEADLVLGVMAGLPFALKGQMPGGLA